MCVWIWTPERRTHVHVHTLTHTYTHCVYISMCYYGNCTFNLSHATLQSDPIIHAFTNYIQRKTHTSCRKEAHLSIKFSNDPSYQYFNSTMTCNHKNNFYFCQCSFMGYVLIYIHVVTLSMYYHGGDTYAYSSQWLAACFQVNSGCMVYFTTIPMLYIQFDIHNVMYIQWNTT